ncbi:hypothetical protein NVP1054O_33 [Vibrio phage 1.054.O._10N.261.52.A1]|nr:hypothetical protein NVP1054O_33 [Vibrio phage 1.054.O._10N.261.52.A1]
MFPVNKIVQVNEFFVPGGLGFVNFGIAMEFGLSAELTGGTQWPVNTYKSFFSLNDVGQYYSETTETYKLASRWFANKGKELFIFLRDEGNDSPVTSATKARGLKWFYHQLWTKDVTDVEADAILLADWGDSNGSYLWLASDSPDVGDPNKTDDIASVLLSKGNRRIAIGYRQAGTIATDSSQIYFMAALAAETSKVNYSGLQTAIDTDFKSLIGVIAEDLSPSEITALEAKKVTMYTITEEGNQRDVGVVLNSWSMSPYNETPADVIDADAMSSGLRVTSYNVFRRNKKTQMTPRGQAQCIGAADLLLKSYFDNGVLGAGMIENPITGEMEYAEFGYFIYTKPEDILKQNPADRKDREMYPLNARVNRSLSGRSLTLDLNIQ